MEQETQNESVRPLLMLLAFASTKLVARISWVSYASLLALLFPSSSLHLALKDEISRWISWAALFLYLMDAALICFFLSNDLGFPPPLMLSCSLLSKLYCFFPSDILDYWSKTRWILRHLLPLHRSLVLSCHECWHPGLLAGGGLLEFWPLLPKYWK